MSLKLFSPLFVIRSRFSLTGAALAFVFSLLGLLALLSWLVQHLFHIQIDYISVEESSRWLPWVMVVGGLLVSLLFLSLVYFAVTARRREREWRLSQSFLETILDELPVALFCKDIRNDFRFSVWNRKAEELWGMKRAEVVGKSDYDFFPKEQADWFRKKDKDTVQLGSMLVIPEEAVTSPIKGEVIVRTKKVIISDEGRQPLLLVGISEDITQQKRDQVLIESQKLQMVNTAKMTALGEMAGGIAHEINNPLAIIEVYAEQLSLLAAEEVIVNVKVAKAASVISATVDRIAKITRGLRSFARDAEDDPVIKTSVRKVLSETLDFCREKFMKHGVNLALGAIPATLEFECRPVQISQVVLNLLNNSLDAVGDIPGSFVKVDAFDESSRILITVTDSGPSIDFTVRDKIMQPFYTTKPVGKGTGLGLSISQGIVQGHKGELYLDPTSSNTRFVIAIPKQQGAK